MNNIDTNVTAYQLGPITIMRGTATTAQTPRIPRTTPARTGRTRQHRGQ